MIPFCFRSDWFDRESYLVTLSLYLYLHCLSFERRWKPKLAVKKNKNNPDNKAKAVKQNKIHDSFYCENTCKETESCQKYKKYMASMIAGKVGLGLVCNK